LGTRYLQKNEYLLADQYIVGNKKIREDQLKHYYLQHTNRKILGIPFWLWIYELGRLNFNKKALKKKYKLVKLRYEKKAANVTNRPEKLKRLEEAKKKKLEDIEDLLKHGNWLMRTGERPAIYSSQKRISTEDNLLQYLHTKGFFNARANSFVKKKGQRAYVIYYIQENQPFIIKDISLHSADPAIEKLLQPYSQHTLLKRGQNYDQDVLTAERTRIYDFLADNGYWSFNKQYVAFNVDTTANNNAVSIETILLLPTDSKPHPVYNLANIQLSISSNDATDHSSEARTYRGITFKNTKQHFAPASIVDKIPLKLGQIYRKSDIVETQKRLMSLGIFRNIHIGHEIIDSTHLRTNICTSLLDKFQLEQELGTEFTRLSFVPFYRLSFKSRNLFKKLETLTLKSQLGIEASSFSPTDQQKSYYNERNVHTALELTLPQLLFPLPVTTRANLDAYKPNTKLHLGYTFTKQLNYTKQTVKTLLSYIWYPNLITTVELTPVSIGLADFRLGHVFKQHLEPSKEKKYKPSLITYSNLKLTFKKDDGCKRFYSCLETLLESGGTLQNVIDFKKLFGDYLNYYKYLKIDLAYKRHIPLYNSTIFAYQLYMGVLYPYSDDEYKDDEYKVAPDDKYYFIGGPSSIRAWPSKGLGPGSYRANDTQKEFMEERGGEFILQANLELRQKLVGFVEAAFFIDMGNVWMLRDNSRIGQEFELTRFYKEIAIGTGVGLRLNFNFLVLRFDFGFKVYDPSLTPGERFLPENMLQHRFNFGLGYPF
jgi:outer membrane protein assembly factor BamA